MIRKLLVVAAAIAMPVSVIAVSGGAAGAKTPPTGPQYDTVHCTNETATIGFSIPLTLSGVTSGTQVTTVSGTVSGCTVSGPTAEPAVTSGTISGTLTAKKAGSAKHPTGTCTGLLGVTKESGNLTITWGHSIPTSSTAVKSATGGTSSGGNGTFAIAGKAVAGSSFEGTDKGKSSSLGAQTVDTVGDLTTACESGSISSLAIEATSAGITLS